MLNEAGILSKFSMAMAGVLALAVTAIATPAAAANWKFAPAPSTFKLSGTLNLEQTVNLDCQVDVHVSVNTAGEATVTNRSFSPGSPACGLLINAFGTWELTPNSATQVTATVGATSIAGQCSGSILATWNNSTQTLSFNNATVPGNPGGCTVNGTLTSNNPNVRIVHN